MPTFLGGALAAQVPPMRLVSRVNEEYAGACPFCGGDQHRSDRFHIWLKPTGQERFWCRRCDRKGRTAQLLGDTKQPGQSVIITPPLYDAPRPHTRNIAVYRQLYAHVADWAMANLHQSCNPEPLAYLHQRGFSTETVHWA